MLTIAVIILTKNEETKIVNCIESVKDHVNEIILIDSGSTDETVLMAEKLGAKIRFRAWDNDFAAQRNFALEQTNADIVFYLDADEIPNEELLKSLDKIRQKDKLDKCYKIIRKNLAFGDEFKYGVLRPDKVTRIFPRKKVSWVGKVHERPICELPVEELLGFVKHYTYDSWEQYYTKFNSYTSIWAQDAYVKGKRTTMANAYAHAIGGFFQMTILKMGILDGWLGLVLCCNHFMYTLIKYLKLLENQKKDNRNANIS